MPFSSHSDYDSKRMNIQRVSRKAPSGLGGCPEALRREDQVSWFECASKEGVSVRRGLCVRSPFVAIWFAMPSVILGLCLLMWVCVESFPAFFAWPPSASEVSERLFPAIAAFARNLPEVEESCTAVGLQKLIVQTMRRYVNVRAVALGQHCKTWRMTRMPSAATASKESLLKWQALPTCIAFWRQGC